MDVHHNITPLVVLVDVSQVLQVQDHHLPEPAVEVELKQPAEMVGLRGEVDRQVKLEL